MDYQLMTARAFMQSYDRDVLELQDDPECYIVEVEGELVSTYPYAYDNQGNKVWPVAVLKAHLQIQGNPQWPELMSPPNPTSPR